MIIVDQSGILYQLMNYNNNPTIYTIKMNTVLSAGTVTFNFAIPALEVIVA
jgi:hypothetical protein